VPSPWSFTFEPVFLVASLAAGLLYLRATRGARSTRLRSIAFWSGLALIAVPLNSPLETIAVDYLLLFHLLQNVMISDWAPLLLLAGLGPDLRQKIASGLGPAFAHLVRPRVALPLWLVGWYAVHLGGVYDLALRHPLLLNVEHLFMIAIGLVFWWPVISDVPRAAATAARLAYVFAAFVLSAFLGIALTFAPSVYGYYGSLPDRLWGISVDADQSLGGILMTTEQVLVFFGAIVWLLQRLFREETEAEERLAQAQREAGLRKH
jgi:cytochrome c oxidase assembly factor CtaG